LINAISLIFIIVGISGLVSLIIVVFLYFLGKDINESGIFFPDPKLPSGR